MMKRFKLTRQHLILLRNANVEYEEHFEFGAPWIDPKRPYGNSDVYNDIARLLKIEPEGELTGEDEYEREFTDAQYTFMEKLHKETATALQIILYTGKFKTGTYETKEEYSNSWRSIK